VWARMERIAARMSTALADRSGVGALGGGAQGDVGGDSFGAMGGGGGGNKLSRISEAAAVDDVVLEEQEERDDQKLLSGETS